MKRIILLCLLACSISNAFAQNQVFNIYTDSVALRQDNDRLIRDVEERIQRIDSSFSFNHMKTVVQDSLFSGNYLYSTNTIYLPQWTTMPQEILDFCTAMMDGQKEGEQLASLYFYGFFLPHEIAHGIQFNSHVRKDNEYDNEYEASAIAYLYWKDQGKEKELEACYQIAKTCVSKLPNPIPEDEDVKAYFTNHYEEMAQDASQYAYMLFTQIVSIFEDQNLPDFDTYITAYIKQ